MRDLADGDSTQIQGSGSSIYTLKNSGGVYSCTCPAWTHQSLGIERRTCKHLRALRGDDAERARLGTAELSGKPVPRVLPDGSPAPAAPASEAPILLAHKWELDVDLTGWWMSEKLDGVRAYWDGARFLSRLGNQFFPPDWFVAALPKIPLDGELWGGRKKFQRTVGTVKRQDKNDVAWREIRYVVFDAPSHGGAFEERIAHCEALVGGKLAHVEVLAHEICRDHDHLKAELARVEALGGEGLMLRRPKSKYEVGRSHTLLKVKSFHDAEARVLEHVPGMGRHKGRLGALLVELPNGTRFNVGTGFSDAERATPPPLGAIITFRYQELSDGGVPRFPSYVAVRDDFRWPGEAAGGKVEARRAIPTAPSPRSPSRSTPAASTAPGRPRPTRQPTTEETSAMPRYEMTEGGSNKFWYITMDGTSFTTTFGRIGTAGSSSTKDWASVDQCRKEHDKLVAEKVKKGYKLVGGTGASGAKPAKAAPAAKAAKPAKVALGTDTAVKALSAKPAKKGGKNGPRYFEFVGGGSSKFWEIRLEGTGFTTRFGKIGSGGNESTKDFGTVEKAQKEYEKLVAEKTGKGYQEKR
jgi:DNA ligase-1